MADTPREHWVTGDAYEHFMGRWSAEVATLFLKWLDQSPEQSWLDVGCGTGALTREIVRRAAPQMVVGLDRSGDFARFAHQHTPSATFFVSDGSALALANSSFDVIVSGLALNFIPQPAQAIAELYRVAKSSGTVAAYVWDYAGKMEFLRYFWDAAVELDANAAPHHEGNRFPICQPEPLRQLWQSAGFQNITVDALDIPTIFTDFEAYWQPFTVGNFPAPQYLSSLDITQRASLREHLSKTVPTQANGSIHLIARVWAVRGSR